MAHQPEHHPKTGAPVGPAMADNTGRDSVWAQALADDGMKPLGEQRGIVRVLQAVADEEQQELRARVLGYENRITWDTNCGEHARLLDSCRVTQERAERAEAERDRLRAELGQARGAVAEMGQAIRLTREYAGEELLPAVEGWSWYDALRRHAPNELGAGQDTTAPADGEQETRRQIRIACAIAERVPVTELEPHDYQEHANAVLAVVRTSVAAGVRRALEDAADEVPDVSRWGMREWLRARAAVVPGP